MNILKKKIRHLRQQPEDVRLRAVGKFTFFSGLILVILWLIVFLPLQLSLRKQDTAPLLPPDIVPQGIATASPAPEPLKATPTPAAPDAAGTSVQFLPTNEDQVSSSPNIPVEVTP